MKSPKLTVARITTLALLSLATLATSSFAASNPLNNPRGLAVDSKGNLWVANSGDNNVVAFSSSYKQLTANTITQSVSNPTGVAFDPLGNLWVANYGGGGSVTMYSPTGKQNTAATITNGILGPNAIAVDGLGDVWVENDFVNVTVYSPTGPYTPASQLVRTFSLFPVYGIAVGGQNFSWGSNNATSLVGEATALATGGFNGYAYGDSAFALANDASGNLYMGDLNGTVNIATPQNFEVGPFATLSFTPAGIAVDSVHGRVYISNQNGNEILVYSTAGALLHTIK